MLDWFTCFHELRFGDAVTGISEDQLVVFTKRKNDK